MLLFLLNSFNQSRKAFFIPLTISSIILSNITNLLVSFSLHSLLPLSLCIFSTVTHHSPYITTFFSCFVSFQLPLRPFFSLFLKKHVNTLFKEKNSLHFGQYMLHQSWFHSRSLVWNKEDGCVTASLETQLEVKNDVRQTKAITMIFFKSHPKPNIMTLIGQAVNFKYVNISNMDDLRKRPMTSSNLYSHLMQWFLC